MKLLPFLLISSLFVLGACAEENPGQISNLSDGTNIIGGTEVTKGDERRYYVAKLEISEGGRSNTCTATQITETMLLTAAHCFMDEDKKPRRPQSARIYYNSDSWRSQSRLVKKIIIHPDYPRDPRADLALVRITGLAPDSQKLIPISFEKPSHDFFGLLSIGYGITNLTKRHEKEAGTGLGVLRAVETFSIGYTQQDREILIDQSRGKGINAGDSGGPALFLVDGKPYLVGVAKSVLPRLVNGVVRYDLTGAYTSTIAYKPWILETLLKNSEL